MTTTPVEPPKVVDQNIQTPTTPTTQTPKTVTPKQETPTVDYNTSV